MLMRICIFFRLLFIFFFLLKGASLKAQSGPGRYSLTHYNSDNGLPQNSINGMAFDRNGFLWLATKMGIVRFDGRHFREYNKENSPALHWDEYSLPQTAPGTGLIRIKPVYDSLILAVTGGYGIETDSLLAGIPYQFTTSNNHLFYSTAISKRQLLNSHDGKYRQLLNKLNTSKGLVTINERQGYFKDGDDCYFLDDNTGSITALTGLAGHGLVLQFAVGDVFIYIDDRYRMYAYKNGLLQKKITATERLQRLLAAVAAVDPDPVQASLKIRRDGRHTLMVCADTIRLISMVNNVLTDTILAADAPIKDIKCMVYDEAAQALYAGTITSGLYVLKMHEFDRLFFDSARFMTNSQFAQVELADGRILTAAGILSRDNKMNLLFPGTRHPDKQAWLQASDGSTWYSEQDSLQRADVHFQRSAAVQHLDGPLTGIIERDNKQIVYSTLHQLYTRDGKEEAVLFNHPALLQQAEIQVIREAGKNNIWIGTSKGLFSYDLLRHSLCRLPFPGNASVAVIHIAKDSSVWIGTYGQGFYKWHENKFVRLPQDDKKSLAMVHCFLEDKQGYFWMPANKGLFRVTKKELDNYASGSREQVYYYYVDKSWGYSSNEFNGRCTPCGIETKDGHFFFPSLDGLVGFNPDSLHVGLPDKPIFIELVGADDKKTLLRDGLTASQDSNRLAFDISSPYFGSKANLRLEYSIKEINETWYPVGDDGRLILTQLPRGVYTLTVRKQDHYAHYTYNSLRLTILPYWYEKTWFRCLWGGLAIGVFLFFFRVRYNFQVKRAELLEQKVTERTEQLSDSNRVKELMISIILHDLRSPLRFLHILAQRMYTEHKKNEDKNLSRILFQFQHATNEVYDFTQNFFVFTNMQKEGFVINRERIVLRDMVDSIISLYEVGADIQKNSFVNLVPEQVTLHTDPGLLSLVIRNLVDNANKYTPGGEIKLEAWQDPSGTRFIITDAAGRIDEELAKRIVDKTYNPEDPREGWGYKIIIEILGRLNGSLVIDTSGHEGNKIIVTLERDV